MQKYFFQVAGVEISVENLTIIVIPPLNLRKIVFWARISVWNINFTGNEDAHDRIFFLDALDISTREADRRVSKERGWSTNGICKRKYICSATIFR